MNYIRSNYLREGPLQTIFLEAERNTGAEKEKQKTVGGLVKLL